MKTPQIVIAFFLAAATLTSGCANTDPRPVISQADAVYGVIDLIEMTSEDSGGIGGSGIGAGAVIGGVVGGVLGSQVGSGAGQDIATVAGVAGGAVAGHQIEKSRRQPRTYRIRVRLEGGEYRTVTQQDIAGLSVGDRVRIENDRVSRY